MVTNKFLVSIVAFITIVPIVNSIYIDRANANPTKQESDAEIDQRKAQEVFRTPLSEFQRSQYGDSDETRLKLITRKWENIVDAAGLHTLLNKNKQAYTRLEFHFETGMSSSSIKELFAPENRTDLQRILRCNVVPLALSKANIPNGSTVVLKTMENSCTVTVKGRFIDEVIPEEETSEEPNGTECSYEGSIGGLPVRRCHATSRVITRKTGRMIRLKRDTVWIDGQISDERNNEKKRNGNYISYHINKMKMPPDLQLKYGR